MKSTYVILVLTIALVSCNTEEEGPQLVSKWHLIEQLADPGNGSGTFQPVSSQKTIEFLEDGTLTSNGSLCNMEVQVGNGSSGIYNNSDSTIIVEDCGFAPPYPMTFEMQNGFLILNYPCIEPCREKYEPVE